ncbi:MAG: FG-GAP-like repeat-containing protein [Flavobacteriaceae bacterium]
MKTHFLIVLLFIIQTTTAQIFNPTPQLIDDDARVGTFAVGDFNNDGKQDIVLATSQLLVWYENDGQGNFGAPVVIDTDPGQSFNINATDLEQDGKIDILISSFGHDKLYFYRNLGGGNFAPRVVLTENLDRTRSAEAADLNGNGFLDLVIGITNSVGLYWMEHLDGQGNFALPTPISTTLAQARTQKVGDINGNGHLDVLSNSGGSTLLSWFENDGQGNFTAQHVVENSGLYHINLFLIDMDNDGDLDIASYSSDGVFWYENLDGLGNFGPKQTINPTTDPEIDYASLFPIDIDNNGTMDVVYFSTVNRGINYQINDGAGNFSPPIFVEPPTTGLLNFGGNFPIDIDGDGDIDLINTVFQGAVNPFIIWWTENQTILSAQDMVFNGLTITPNPVDNLLTIKSKTPIKTVTFYQVEGKTLKTIESGFEAIDVSFLRAGVYFVLIESIEGASVVKTVIKK